MLNLWPFLFDTKIEAKLPKALYDTQYTLGVVIARFAKCVCVHSLNSLRNLCAIVETETAGSQLVPARSCLWRLFNGLRQAFGQRLVSFPYLPA